MWKGLVFHITIHPRIFSLESSGRWLQVTSLLGVRSHEIAMETERGFKPRGSVASLRRPSRARSVGSSTQSSCQRSKTLHFWQACLGQWRDYLDTHPISVSLTGMQADPVPLWSLPGVEPCEAHVLQHGLGQSADLLAVCLEVPGERRLWDLGNKAAVAAANISFKLSNCFITHYIPCCHCLLFSFCSL